MSLQEITLITILKSLSDGILILDPNLPLYYVEMISGYVDSDPADSYIKSISNNQFQLAEYFFKNIKTDDAHMNILRAMKDQACNRNITGIDYLINKHQNRCGLLHYLFDYGLLGAVYGSHHDLVKRFTALGADINYGLLIALKIDNNELIQFFVENGANFLNIDD